ncbi:MAG: S8 family serine peptidase, partial [Thermoplasmata archaeon]|nr:S8 family serine peptidase [Thermoplasmata archaeon]
MQRNKINLMTMLAVFVAISMIAPTTFLMAEDGIGQAAAPNDSEDFYTVIFGDNAQKQSLLRENGIEIVKMDQWGAVIKANYNMKQNMGAKYMINDMPDRTRVKLMEAGVEFDSRLGYDVPAKWKKEGSDLYLVQFVAPLETDWLDGLRSISSAYFNTIGDNLAVVKLSPQQKEAVAAMPYIEWMDTYQPYFKVFQNAREQTGEFMIKATPMGVSIEELAHQMTLLGALDTALNDGCSMVEATVTDSILPDIAKLESVAMIQYYPEMVQQGSMSGEIVGAHCAWDVTRSNLPQAIRGEGQVYQHQDLGIDASHQDFTMGALGNRLIYAESSTDSNSHSTTCVGMAAGNGYDMEGWLGQGLDNMDRNYYDLAPTNPQGFLDRVGFAGRAPETGIVSYNGLLTSEWDDGYTTYGARVFSNSFGPGPVTQGYTNDGDVFMTAYPEGLIVFCMCNYGPNEMTGSGVCNGKMNLGVGAVENNRGDWFQSDDNPFQIWASSSKGPVSPSDLRVKPDVVEFGAGILSCKSDDSGDDANTVYRGGENIAAWMVNYDPDARGDYQKNQGTSFSSPAAAGDCILIRDYLEDIKGIAIPDPILIKTYLIHGAQDMGYGFPSYGQGWGLCNIEYSICPPAPLTNVYWEGTASDSWTIDVNSAGAPLKVTMSHWDSGTASGTLTTDYDVVVTSPTGKRYEGNAFAESISTEINGPADWSGCAFPSWAQSDGIGSGPYDWDTADDGGDDINTVEVCLIDNPEKGIWIVDVDAKSGAGPSWFVVASADFGPVDSYNVEMAQDANLVYSMSDGYGTCAYQASPGDTVAVGFTVQNFGTNADTIDLAATRQDYGYGIGSPIPAGWSVTYDTGSSQALASEDIVHVTAYVTTSGTAAEGTYALKVTGSSTNSVIAQDYIIFNVDIIDQRLPDRVRVTDHPLADMSPGVAAWNDGGTEYVVVSYQHDTGMGERVAVSVSNDGGQSFGNQIIITSEADDPQYLNLKVAPAGHDYEGRMFISYNSMQPLLSGYNWDEVSNRRCMICYADPPYDTWNVVAAFDNGEGPASFNDYRATDVGFWINPGGPDEVHLIEENYYNNADDMNSAWEDIMTAERISMDGGATWPVTNEINTGSLNFAPSASDDSGDLILTFYESSGGRRMYYTRYTGSWGAPVVGMDFGS